MNIKESWNKLKWKKTFIGTVSAIVAVSVAAPVVSYIARTAAPEVLQRYEFDSKEFNSRAEMFAYAKSAAEVNTQTIRSRDRWSVKYNNKLIAFNDITDLNEFVRKNIVTYQAATSMYIEAGIDGKISPRDYANLNLNSGTSISGWETMEIYRGKDNAFYASEKDAKDSYLQVHDAYLFDNIFFRNKEELTVYLYNNYDKIAVKEDNIVIVAPNGNYSQPISLLKIDDANIKDYITLFVKNNATEYLEVKAVDNDVDTYKYFDKEKIRQNLSDVAFELHDTAYVTINSNQGKANYIMDANVTDEHEFFGPYYTKSSASLKKITDRNAWRKVEGKDQKFVDNQLETQLFSNFLDDIIGEDTPKSGGYPFNFSDASEATNKLIANYFQSLKKANEKVYASVMKLNEHMRKGKRYSSFYKLPILFIHTIEQLVLHNSKQNIIEESRNFYIAMAKYYDVRLRTIIPAVFLKHKDVDNKYFSLVELLGFEKRNLDMNIDIETYIDIINDYYPWIFHVAKYYSYVVTIGTTASYLFTYDNKSVCRLTGMDLLLMDNNVTQGYKESELTKGFEEIWDAVINSDADIAQSKLEAIARGNGLNPDKAVIDEILAKFVLPKQIAKSNIVSGIERDVAKINNNEYNAGFPNEYQFAETSYFRNLDSNFTKSVTNLIALNNGEVDDRYLGLLKMHQQSTGRMPPAIYFNSTYSINISALNALVIASVISIPRLIGLAPTLYGAGLLAFSYCINPNDEVLRKRWEANVAAMSVVKDLLDIYKNYFEIATTILKLLDAAKDVLDALSAVLTFIPLASIVITILTNLVSTNEYSYIFDSEDVKYIWNGGKERKWLFGMIDEKISDIENMQILEPFKVTEQHIESGKYYNGKIYDQDDILKKDQLMDVLNNEFQNEGLRTVYGFQEQIHASPDIPSPDVRGEIGNLTDDNDDDLVDVVYDKIKKDNGSLTQNIYSYANGYTFDKSTSEDANIKDIYNNINPVKVVNTPNLLNSYPIIDDTKIDDGSIPEYVLPQTSWTTERDEVVVNKTDNNYIVFDPNRDYVEAPPLTEAEILDKIRTIFYDTFNVPSKTILRADQFKYEKYSEYSTNITKSNVYKATLDTGQSEMYFEEADAFSWLLSKLDFTVYDTFVTNSDYTFQGNHFKNLQLYLEWVLANAKEI